MGVEHPTPGSLLREVLSSEGCCVDGLAVGPTQHLALTRVPLPSDSMAPDAPCPCKAENPARRHLSLLPPKCPVLCLLPGSHKARA